MKILVTGACGQIGTELTIALRQKFGYDNVIATDRLAAEGIQQLDVMDFTNMLRIVKDFGVKQIYHLAAILSANGEKDPINSWNVNMDSTLNVLEVARIANIDKVFFPSSIAVFGDHVDQIAAQNSVTQPGTVYGISKVSGELWCRYYREKHGVDVRSIRYPGLISYTAKPGGGTTDYAVDIFHQAIEKGSYSCFLSGETRLPMLYMPDAIRATIELMDAPKKNLSVSTAYNISGLSFTPKELAAEIAKYMPGFAIAYRPDFRQAIADSWPAILEAQEAHDDWGWKPAYQLSDMVIDMLDNLNRLKN